MNVHSFYDEQLNRYGSDDPRGLGWRDDNSQADRFKVLSEIADLNGASVLDEGCGFGDLYPYLTGRFANIKYKGVDINERLIRAAQGKYPGVEFEVADFAAYRGEPVDYVLASGSLTFRVRQYRDVYFGHIEKMFSLAQKGVAFNMLDARYYEGDDVYATYMIPEVYDFCAQLTNNLTIRHDYLPEDFTVYLYH